MYQAPLDGLVEVLGVPGAAVGISPGPGILLSPEVLEDTVSEGSKEMIQARCWRSGVVLLEAGRGNELSLLYR